MKHIKDNSLAVLVIMAVGSIIGTILIFYIFLMSVTIDYEQENGSDKESRSLVQQVYKIKRFGPQRILQVYYMRNTIANERNALRPLPGKTTL
jgi:Na+/melibiose symporter-like transporter